MGIQQKNNGVERTIVATSNGLTLTSISYRSDITPDEHCMLYSLREDDPAPGVHPVVSARDVTSYNEKEFDSKCDKIKDQMLYVMKHYNKQ